MVRQSLLVGEARPAGARIDGNLRIDGHDSATIASLFVPMEEAGLIKVTVLSFEAAGPLQDNVTAITWKGYDFLEHAGNDSIWARAKGTIKKQGLGLTIEMLKIALVEFGKRALKAKLGLKLD